MGNRAKILVQVSCVCARLFPPYCLPPYGSSTPGSSTLFVKYVSFDTPPVALPLLFALLSFVLPQRSPPHPSPSFSLGMISGVVAPNRPGGSEGNGKGEGRGEKGKGNVSRSAQGPLSSGPPPIKYTQHAIPCILGRPVTSDG